MAERRLSVDRMVTPQCLTLTSIVRVKLPRGALTV
jgi:hypothetical protein